MWDVAGAQAGGASRACFPASVPACSPNPRRGASLPLPSPCSAALRPLDPGRGAPPHPLHVQCPGARPGTRAPLLVGGVLTPVTAAGVPNGCQPVLPGQALSLVTAVGGGGHSGNLPSGSTSPGARRRAGQSGAHTCWTDTREAGTVGSPVSHSVVWHLPGLSRERRGRAGPCATQS